MNFSTFSTEKSCALIYIMYHMKSICKCKCLILCISSYINETKVGLNNKNVNKMQKYDLKNLFYKNWGYLFLEKELFLYCATLYNHIACECVWTWACAAPVEDENHFVLHSLTRVWCAEVTLSLQSFAAFFLSLVLILCPTPFVRPIRLCSCMTTSAPLTPAYLLTGWMHTGEEGCVSPADRPHWPLKVFQSSRDIIHVPTSMFLLQ